MRALAVSVFPAQFKLNKHSHPHHPWTDNSHCPQTAHACSGHIHALSLHIQTKHWDSETRVFSALQGTCSSPFQLKAQLDRGKAFASADNCLHTVADFELRRFETSEHAQLQHIAPRGSWEAANRLQRRAAKPTDWSEVEIARAFGCC